MRHRRTHILALITILISGALPTQLISTAAGIGPYLLTQELLSTSPTDYARFGESVAISADGSTAVVGVPFEAGVGAGDGAAYLFERRGNTWGLSARLTDGGSIAGAYFGTAVGASADGSTVVVSTWFYGVGGPPGSTYGSALIFTRPIGGWASTSAGTARLTSTSPSSLSSYGKSAAISGDGATVVIGANTALSAGAGFVYERPPGGWANATETATLTTSQPGATQLGSSAAISADGSTIALGAPSTSGDVDGSVHVYERPLGGWVSGVQQAALTVADALALGTSVAVSADGSTIVAGSPTNIISRSNGSFFVSSVGVAYVFARGAGWSPQAAVAALTARAASQESARELGAAVAISGDGGTILAGALRDSRSGDRYGSALLYRRSGASWAPMGEDLLIEASVPGAISNFGSATAISSDGKTLVIGQPGSNGNGTSRGRAEIREEIVRATISLPIVARP